jgi:hypothetical protein
MRELIRYILKENRLQQELKQVVKDGNIFDAADLVGGISPLKKIFKDDPEMSSLFEKLIGTITFYYYMNKEQNMEFPLKYEIIGRKSNVYNTNHWPEINVLYDENKLTPEENDTFKSIIKYLYDEAQHSSFKSNFMDARLFNSNYLTVKEINGQHIDSIENRHPWIHEVVDIHNKLYGESESLNESEKDTKKLFKITKMIMEDMILPEYNHIICSYEITLNEVFNIPEVTVLFIGGYGTKLWPMTQGIRQMYLNVLEDISKEIANYTGVVIGVRGEQTPKCGDKENIYLRESKSKDKEYSPAGKEITPNKIVIHKSNPKFRDKIIEQGLKVRAGECYKIYAGYGTKCKPAIFATNSTNKRAWFDSTYDDDVWEIDTTMMPEIKWFKDRHYESSKKHIVTFQDIPKEAIKLIYEGSGKDSGLMESENKSEDKKLKLVKEMIYSLFDEVEFIEVDTNYEGKPLIKIYHDVEDTAANYDNWFAHKIQDEIKEMTGDGIILSPWWAAGWDWKYKNADFFIDVEKLKYDNLGNVINESENKKERKFNRLIQKVEDYLNSNEYPSVKKFTVYYDDTHDDVIVNIFYNVEDSIRLGGGINSVIKRVGKQVMEDLEVFPMDFKYYIHFDRDINESTEKQPKYLNIIEDLVEPFKDEDGVCDIKVSYDDDDDMYSVYIVMGTEEMNDKFFYVPMIQSHISKLRINVKTTIKDYLPIDNLYVGSYGKPNCKWNFLNESSIKEKSLVKLIEKDGLYDFIVMAGLDFNQVRSLLKNIDNSKEILKQYIREFVIEYDGMSGENHGSLFALRLPLSNTKYVDDIMVQDREQIAVEIIEYHIDEYGHREDKDQYLTTINNLTNDELLSILSWMMETVEGGYWF